MICHARSLFVVPLLLVVSCNFTGEPGYVRGDEVEIDEKGIRPESRPALGEIQLLTIETYDGSGQVVHPDVVTLPESWTGKDKFLAITPYPNGNALHENPSIYTSVHGVVWTETEKGVNPIARPQAGHLSDPDILYNPETKELWIYYREVTRTNDILLIKSSDGITWSKPRLVLSAPNHELLGPSVVRRGRGDWLMWTVNGGAVGCSGSSTTVQLRYSSDGINWSASVDATVPHEGVFPWHIEVVWIPSHNEFWALYNGKTAGSCTTGALYFARSNDGLEWTTFRAPLLQRGIIPEFQDVVYRSALQYDQVTDEITFWYSGARYEGRSYIWKAATQRLKRSVVFELADLVVPLTGKTPSPPLTDATAP